MKIKKVVNPAYQELQDWVDNVPRDFADVKTVLHDQRNVVKAFQQGESWFAIKYFKRITIANRIIYRFLRKSKGQRAYEYALELIKRDIPTPYPVAYLDVYDGIFLTGSYFISVLVDYESFNDAARKGDIFLFESFSRFIYFCHQKQVFHQDLNMGNVLCRKRNGKYEFCLIDNNRMSFHKPTRYRISKNLSLLNLPIAQYVLIAGRYADLAQSDAYVFLYNLLKVKNMIGLKRTFRYSLKKFFGLQVKKT